MNLMSETDCFSSAVLSVYFLCVLCGKMQLNRRGRKETQSAFTKPFIILALLNFLPMKCPSASQTQRNVNSAWAFHLTTKK